MREYAKKFKYKGFDNPIIVYDNGDAEYRGREVEKYFHGYKPVGMASGFSISELTKAHYIEEMKRIDEEIRQEEYRKEHEEEFKNLHSADEDIEFFFNMIND